MLMSSDLPYNFNTAVDDTASHLCKDQSDMQKTHPTRLSLHRLPLRRNAMSTLYLIRTFAFLALPLLLAGIISAVDKSVNTRQRRLEIFLIYMFAFGAA